MTQAEARAASRKLNDRLQWRTVACSEDTWFGREPGTSTTWGLVGTGYGFVTDTAQLPESLIEIIEEED